MKHTLTSIGLGLTLALAGAACGSDSKNDPEPRKIGGGGVGDGAIDGVVNVYVIDELSDEIIEGAKVLIGEAGDEEMLEATTDADGYARFDDGSLEGPTTLHVIADGYVVQTWMGVNAANLTIPLTRVDDSTTVDQATLSGTIPDWDQLGTPETNHFYLAFVTYSQTDDLGDDANNIEQPSGSGGLAPNVCATFVDPDECAWSLVTRTGTLAVYATIIDLDTKGTEPGDDDTMTVIGYAYKLGINVEDGVDQSSLSLEMIDGADIADVDLVVPDAPDGLDTTGAMLALEAGSSGLIVVGFLQDADQPIAAPELTGDFAGYSYRALAFAGEDNGGTQDEETDNDPMSGMILRDISPLPGEVRFGDWMDMASDLGVDSGGVYSFTGVTGSAFHGVNLLDSNDKQVWNIALLDGRTEFQLPDLGADDPMPSGTVDMTVDAFEVDVDLQDFAIDDFIDTFERISKARATL